MVLENEHVRVVITEYEPYTISFANDRPHDIVWNPMGLEWDDCARKALFIEVYQREKNYQGVLLVESYVFNENCAILTDNRLTVLCHYGLVQLNVVNRQVVFCRELPSTFDKFAIYPCPEEVGGYVVWGECDIIKLNENFEAEWITGGADIFVSQTGEPAFQIAQGRILLNDFSGNHYELDFGGNTLLFRPKQ